ncbi:MAG TPA: ATP-binding protein [Candidatus Aphodovivens avicola]|nr:ATP-binding protein [Candidatus Aphodovivens avicola]
MDRFLMNSLVHWKESPHRKPLILNGARQVGKTWLLKEFARLHFDSVAYVTLDSNSVARALFDADLDPKRIIRDLSVLTGVSIEPHDTLIVLDEIQSAPKALTSLKYFCENAPEYAVAAAGSLLGISATAGTGYPVGKVNTLDLYPLSFREFLDATGNRMLRELIDSGEVASIDAFSSKAITLLRQYYVVGGMPAVVDAFAEGESFAVVRAMQDQILEDYLRDFAKHAPMRIYPRMVEAWGSIPEHLARENKKFVFGHIRKGARAKDYEEALMWLSQAGLIRKVPRVTKPGIPLSAYNDNKSFKVFLLDVGLLGAMAGLDPVNVLDGNAAFTEFKGSLAEQYVCQQLVSDCGFDPFYWSAENSKGEIDFLVQRGGRVFPIEVKAEENLRAKSLRAFKGSYPETAPIRFSLSGYREQDWMKNIPLYAISNTELWE